MARGDFWTLVLLGVGLVWYALQQSSSGSPVAVDTNFDPATADDLTGTGVTNSQGGLSWSLKALATAIATAEGYGVVDAIPTVANNPGDLKLAGTPTVGEGISQFPDAASGWNALYHQLLLIQNGQSHVYNLSMTIRDLAGKWTTTQQDAWAANVLTSLQNQGVPVDETSTLGDLFANG